MLEVDSFFLKKSNADCGQSMAVIVKMKIKKREKMYENNDNRKLMNNGNDVMKIEWNVFNGGTLCTYISSTAMYHC